MDDAEPLISLEDELRAALSPALHLIELVGSGGMGSVYRARDPALRRDVAVKVLSPAMSTVPEARERFEREAAATATVAHPGVVAIHQVGRLPRSGTSFFVMEFIAGRSLQDAFPPGTQLPLDRARRIIGDLAAALAAAHARGLVHRDVKPANVLIEDGSDRVVIVDFGISTLSGDAASPTPDPRLTVEGTSLGTPAYMSPEQAAGERVTAASDVYNLGLLAFELLVGRHPFDGERTPMAMRAAQINRAAPQVAGARTDMDEALGALVDRCLAKSPAARPTAAAVAAALVGDARRAIEWPPPGLLGLRAAALDLRLVLWWFAGAGALLSCALLLATATSAWTGRGGGDVVFRVGLFLLPALVGVTTWVALFGASLWRSVSLMSSLLDARAQAYPWAVLAQVAIDRRDDTASLINRTGRYGLLDEESAKRIVQTTQLASASNLLAAGLLAAAPVMLLLLASSGAADVGKLLDRVATLAILVPPPLLLILDAALFAWERRKLGLGWRARRLFIQLPVAPSAVVRAWLLQVDRGEVAASRWISSYTLRRVAAYVVRLSVGSAGVLLSLSVLTHAGVYVGAANHGAKARSAAQTWIRSESQRTALADAESRFATAAPPPLVLVPALEAARTLLRGADPGESPMPRKFGGANDAVALIAAAGPLPPFWYADAMIGDLPIDQAIEFGVVNRINESYLREAKRLMDLGAADSVVILARRLLAFAERLGSDQPVFNLRLFARSTALEMLEVASRGNSTTPLAAQAAALREALEDIRSERLLRRRSLAALLPLSVDSVTRERLAALDPPRTSLEDATALAYGVCFSPREMLAGVGPERRRQFDAIVARAGSEQERIALRHVSAFLEVVDLPQLQWLAARRYALPAPARLPLPDRMRRAPLRLTICDAFNAIM